MQAGIAPTNHLKDAWDIAAHVASVIGLMAAGVWGYFNFVKSRTYYPRMELSVSGEIITSSDKKFLVPRVILKNIGRSKVQLLQRGSGYKIWIANGRTKVGGSLAWSGGKPTYRIFEQHGWIEPGEAIFDERQLHALPPDCVAAKVEVRLRAPVGIVVPKVTVWTCSAVVGPETKKEGTE
ncbi:hypothetical protein [Tunturiibacter gelidoferens]|jgi:hypothetical protein|uniref:Uncharacterized protein n=1 Tax=Tunturiibacter gelidiferens TaxID=3069689 RepID=A0A9X0U5V9_9BACT|nr:hypothetical protein [Edaphobacter lichenicola]MBB5330951.1 hypothetical protein [Edaphobacter lichenicola]